VKVGIIINTSAYERVSYALTLATTFAAKGDKVYVLFGFDGIKRLIKGQTDLLELGTNKHVIEDIKIGVEAGILSKISDQLSELRKLGGKIYVCVSAMALHNVILNDLIPEIDRVTGLYEFIESLGDEARIIYV
jgi:peroxiredoxin family protein